MIIRIALVALLSMAAGWAGENTSLAMATGAVNAPPTPMLTERKSSFDVVDAVLRMERRNEVLRNLVVEAEIIVARTGKDNVSLSGEYAATGPDYRFQMSWGIVNILDMCAKGEQITMWLPRKGFHCEGRRDLLSEKPNDLRVLGMAKDAQGLVAPDCWATGADKRKVLRDGSGAIVSVFRDGLLARRFVLERIDDDLVVEKVVFFEGGKPMASIRYSGHSRSKDGLILPSRIDIHPSTQTTMSFVVKKMEVNAPKEPRLKPYIPESHAGEAPVPLERVLAMPSLLE